MSTRPIRVDVPVTEWREVNHRVVPFVGPDERREDGDILLTVRDGRRCWVGTDGVCLAVLAGGPQEEALTAKLSRRIVCAAVELGGGENDDVVLEVDADDPAGPILCHVVSRDGRVSLPTGAGRFPNWRSVADREHEVVARVTADRDRLRRVVAEASHAPAGRDTDRPTPRCWLVVDPCGFRIEVTWPGLGRSTFTVTGDTEGEVRLAANPRALSLLLEAAGEGDLELAFGPRPDDVVGLRGTDGWSGFLAPVDPSPEPWRPDVEQTLSRAFGTVVDPDEDGDYLLPAGPVPVWARLIGGEPHCLRLYTVAARGIPPTDDLFAELNDQNASFTLVRAVWLVEAVVYQWDCELEGPGPDPGAVADRAAGLSELAARFGPLLEARFGDAELREHE